MYFVRVYSYWGIPIEMKKKKKPQIFLINLNYLL